MKGKKTDMEFVADFIQAAAQEGIESSHKIVSKAENLIAQIDQEIKAMEERKKLRSKLLDVVSVLQEKVEINNSEEIRLLSFYDFKYPPLCQEICQILKQQNVFNHQSSYKGYDTEIKFCVKQLTVAKILAYQNGQFIKGEKFEDYLQFTLSEHK